MCTCTKSEESALTGDDEEGSGSEGEGSESEDGDAAAGSSDPAKARRQKGDGAAVEQSLEGLSMCKLRGLSLSM